MIVTNFRATRDGYIFQGKKILGKKSLFKQIQKFAIYIAVMFALWKPLVIFYLVEFLFALFLCPLEFSKEIWLFTVHYPLETKLQEGMLITMHTKTTDIHLVHLARAMKDAWIQMWSIAFATQLGSWTSLTVAEWVKCWPRRVVRFYSNLKLR